MSKDRWLYVSTLEEIPMEIWFLYYRERGGIIGDIKEFEHLFTILLWSPSNITLDSAIHNIYNYYNKKYGITE